MLFKNRTEAGQILAKKMRFALSTNPIVLALPRGGVPVAFEIARELAAPLDVLLVRKIGAPDNPELAVGALSEDGHPVYSYGIMNQLDVKEEELEETIREQLTEVKRQLAEFRQGRPPTDLSDRSVILVDDGLATGATMKAAIRIVKGRKASSVIVAIPVAASRSAAILRQSGVQVVTIEEPEDFLAVGHWYYDFTQVSDQEVILQLEQSRRMNSEKGFNGEVSIPKNGTKLEGEMTTPNDPRAVIIFAHGSGSSRKSPRNQMIARQLNEKGLSTLLLDLLTPQESSSRKNIFDITLLSERLRIALNWIKKQNAFKKVPVGFFGASTGAAAVLRVVASEDIFACVLRGGRPDLVDPSILPGIRAPILFIVGGEDRAVLALNEIAQSKMPHSELKVIPFASHLFDEPGALEEVAQMACSWFLDKIPEEMGKTGRKPTSYPIHPEAIH